MPLGESETHRDYVFTTHSGDGNNNVYPIRSVVTADGWKYIRNLHPEYLYTTHITNNSDDSGYWKSWLVSAAENSGDLQKVRSYQERPAEELYHLTGDTWEFVNLAADPSQSERLVELRKTLDEWMVETNDPQKVFGTPKLIEDSRK